MSAEEALKIAESKNLDLVKIAPDAKPPVCKIMNYGKYRFEKAKKEKEARKNQKIVEIKESGFLSISTLTISTLRSTMPASSLHRAIRLRFPSASEAVKWLIPSLV